MRILHVTSLYAPDQVGGAELYVRQLAERQAGCGHAVSVACLSRRPAPVSSLNSVDIYRMGHSTPFFILDWQKETRLRRLQYKVSTQFQLETLSRFSKIRDSLNPDIVHTHSISELSPLVWPYAVQRGAKLVHTLHDYTSMCTNGSMFLDGRACSHQHLKCKIYSIHHRIAQKSVGALAGVGREILEKHLEAALFTHIPESRRKVIWNPIDPPKVQRHRPIVPAGDVIFGYLGRIEPSKGIDLLLEACKQLPKIGWRLIVAGRAVEGLDKYRALAAALPVEFLGFSDPDDFFAKIDCLVVPPLWPEAFGRTVAEAYLRDVPVLGAKIGGVAEQVGDGEPEWLFPPGDVLALKDRLSALIEDKSRLKGGRSGVSRLKKGVAPEVVTNQYMDLYHLLLSSDEAGQR